MNMMGDSKWIYCYEKMYELEKDYDSTFILKQRNDVEAKMEVSVEQSAEYDSMLKQLYSSLKNSDASKVDRIIVSINKLESLIDRTYAKKNYRKKYVSKLDELLKEVDMILKDDNNKK